MNALMLDLQTLSEQLLPILGSIALIFLCVVLKRAWELLEELTKTVKDLGPTIKLVDQSMEKVQAPLDTVVKISHTVDDVQEKASNSLNKVTQVITDNLDKVKVFFTDMFGRDDDQSLYETDDGEQFHEVVSEFDESDVAETENSTLTSDEDKEDINHE